MNRLFSLNRLTRNEFTKTQIRSVIRLLADHVIQLYIVSLPFTTSSNQKLCNLVQL